MDLPDMDVAVVDSRKTKLSEDDCSVAGWSTRDKNQIVLVGGSRGKTRAVEGCTSSLKLTRSSLLTPLALDHIFGSCLSQSALDLRISDLSLDKTTVKASIPFSLGAWGSLNLSSSLDAFLIVRLLQDMGHERCTDPYVLVVVLTV